MIFSGLLGNGSAAFAQGEIAIIAAVAAMRILRNLLNGCCRTMSISSIDESIFIGMGNPLLLILNN
jgi:hypothetical protein